MKSPCVGSLVPNEITTAQFIVTAKEIRQKKTGEPYLSLQLADRTGELEAKMWDNVAEVMHTFDRDDFIKVKGLVQVYQKRFQFTIHRLRRMEDHEVDFADFFPCSERAPEEMFTELQEIIEGLGTIHLRSLLEAIFRDPRIATRYQVAPAAKSIHHACRGGLLQHVLSLCSLVKLLAGHYHQMNLDLDLVLAGAILHDIGKIDELSFTRSFGYTADGQLLGHIVIGLRMIAEKMPEVPDFPPKLRTLLEHLIISHHGELEFGSPKTPCFPEALLLHLVDNLDSKMEAMRSSLERDSTVEGEFTGWVPSLERTLLRKERYLGETARSSSSPVTEENLNTDGPVPVIQGETTQNKLDLDHVPGTPVSTRPEKPAKPAPKNPEPRSAPTTLFGEKLQAVLGSEK